MKKKQKTTTYITQAAVIAALYAGLTYAAGFFNLAYGSIQFRFSEALTVLACITPAAIPGLTIGCFIGNLNSPFGILDIVLGTLATFLAAYFTYVTRKVKNKAGYLLATVFSTVFRQILKPCLNQNLNMNTSVSVVYYTSKTFKNGNLLNASATAFGVGCAPSVRLVMWISSSISAQRTASPNLLI